MLLKFGEVTGAVFTVESSGPSCAANLPRILTTAVGEMGT
jgi:hypothetical protein